MGTLYLIFCIKTFILFLIGRRYGVISLPFLILMVFFFYSQCFFLDYILFGIESISYGKLLSMSVFSDDYFHIVILYFTFFIGFAVVLLLADPPTTIIREVHVYDENRLYNIMLLVGVCLLMIFITKNIYGTGRLEKIAFFASHKILSIPLNIATFGCLILFFKNRVNRKGSYAFYMLSIIIVGFGLVEGGREIFIYILFAYLFSRNKTTINLKEVLMGIICFTLILFWKTISVFLFELNDAARLVRFISGNYRFSFSNMDPQTSLLMIRDYINGDSFYDQFRFSYVLNTLKQFLRTLRLIEYSSISESVSAYYIPTSAKSGAGVAFSGLLESMLNFWYFGPIILGVSLGWVSLKIYYLKYKSFFLYGVFSLFFMIISIKLVRTELAVILKIYVLPMTLAYFFFYKLSFSKRVRRIMKLHNTEC